MTHAAVTIDATGVVAPPNSPQMTVVAALPFRPPTDFDPPAQSGFALIRSSELTYVLTAVTPSAQKTIRLPVDLDRSGDELLQVRQFPAGMTLLMPDIQKISSPSVDSVAQPGTTFVLKSFRKVAIELESGYSVVHTDRIEQLLKSDVFDIIPNTTSGEYSFTYNPPTTSMELKLDEVFGRVLIVLLALSVTFASPGFVPEAYLKPVLIGTVALIVIFVAARWILGYRKGSIGPAMFDTVTAVAYSIGLGVVWWIKKRRSSA